MFCKIGQIIGMEKVTENKFGIHIIIWTTIKTKSNDEILVLQTRFAECPSVKSIQSF